MKLTVRRKPLSSDVHSLSYWARLRKNVVKNNEFSRTSVNGALLRNTLSISVSNLLWGFPAPIILAIVINEIRSARFKKTVQTLTYLPHFVSVVVVCSMVKTFLSLNGPVNTIIQSFGGDPINFFAHGEYFTTIFVVSDIWQHLGWGTIIYLSALTAIDPQLYEAAKLDGAGKLRQITIARRGKNYVAL